MFNESNINCSSKLLLSNSKTMYQHCLYAVSSQSFPNYFVRNITNYRLVLQMLEDRYFCQCTILINKVLFFLRIKLILSIQTQKYVLHSLGTNLMSAIRIFANIVMFTKLRIERIKLSKCADVCTRYTLDAYKYIKQSYILRRTHRHKSTLIHEYITHTPILSCE